jgi:hypothetical protein
MSRDYEASRGILQPHVCSFRGAESRREIMLLQDDSESNSGFVASGSSDLFFLGWVGCPSAVISNKDFVLAGIARACRGLEWDNTNFPKPVISFAHRKEFLEFSLNEPRHERL